MEIQTKTRAVNSRRLFDEMNKLITDALNSVDMSWGNEDERTMFLEYLNSLLHEFYTNGLIEQWKVQCNSLNNLAEDMMNGKYILEISFVQKHCLNTTRIEYTIQE